MATQPEGESATVGDAAARGEMAAHPMVNTATDRMLNLIWKPSFSPRLGGQWLASGHVDP
jgi:hypothetical protein